MEKENTYNPERHRMLEDEKSWVLKDTPSGDFMPRSVAESYNSLVNTIVNANPGMTPQDAIEKIESIEQRLGYKLVGVTYSEDLNRRLVTERKRLTGLEELNLISAEQQAELMSLREQFEEATAEVVKVTGEDRTAIENGLDTLLLYNTAKDIEEAKEILINGPIVEGFESTSDVKIQDTKVKELLRRTFTPQGLRKAQLGRVEKDDTFLIFGNPNRIHDTNELIQRKIVNGGLGGMVVAPDEDHYLQAEMFLEGVDDPSKLKHIYKIRATAGDYGGFSTIKLRSFAVEKPEDFDYLSQVELSDQDKKRAYMLGTLVHEVAHRLEDQSSAVFKEYGRIVNEEITSARNRFVSDYVVKHRDFYGSGELLLVREDFAETVRIYTTNPDYLEKNYPRRFEFINKNFSFVKAGSIVETLKEQYG